MTIEKGPGHTEDDEKVSANANETELDEAWFAAAVTTRRSSLPPPPQERVGEFLGDELADAWLR